MDTRTRTIIIGAIGLFILAAILATIFYLGNVARNRTSQPVVDDGNSLLDLPRTDNDSPTATPAVGTNVPADGRKVFQGEGFTLRYPSNWGVLICGNSKNFEFDPTATQDLMGVVCDRAVKPVTALLVNSLDCSGGDTVNLGGKQVTKSVLTGNGFTDYRWCVATAGQNFDITHRVSSTGTRATSTQDFSAQVEQVIESIQLSGGAS